MTTARALMEGLIRSELALVVCWGQDRCPGSATRNGHKVEWILLSGTNAIMPRDGVLNGDCMADVVSSGRFLRAKTVPVTSS